MRYSKIYLVNTLCGKNILFVFLVLSVLVVKGQTTHKFWVSVEESQITPKGERTIIPKKYKTFRLVEGGLKSVLFSAPSEKDVPLTNSQVIIELPLPDGTIQKFKVVESPVMAPDLAAQFPDIKTFTVKGIDDAYANGKLDWNSFGFHAMLRKPSGDVYIDPYSQDNTTDYISYFTSDFIKDPGKIIKESAPVKNSEIKKKRKRCKRNR